MRNNSQTVESVRCRSDRLAPDAMVVFDRPFLSFVELDQLRQRATQQAQQAEQRAEQAEQQAEKLAAKLRELGIDPNKFLPFAPDFVIELRSATDSFTKLQTKMQVYQDNGVRLGWLINPQDRTVEIYRIGSAKEMLVGPISLSGEDVLPGFVLDLTTIW